MRRYADPARCPDCAGSLPPGARACPQCGLPLSGPLAGELFATLTRADQLLAALREPGPTPAPAPTPGAPAAPAGPPEQGVPAAGVPGAGAPRLPGRSVPAVLLGLGALCLVAAALVFLAVTWSRLGVAGRTGVLLLATAVVATLTAWMGRRGLRAATESLGLVALGMVTLDLLGARAAGWLAVDSISGMALVVGLAVATVALLSTEALSRAPVGAFSGGEVVAGLALLLALLGLVATSEGTVAVRTAAGSAIAASAAVGLRLLAQRRHPTYAVAAGSSVVVAVLAWLMLLGAGMERLGTTPSLASVWIDLDAWPLLVAATVAAVVATTPALPLAGRVAVAGAALVPVAVALVAPSVDETETVLVLSMAAVGAACVALMALVPRPWALSGVAVSVLSGLLLVMTAIELAALAARRYLAAAAELGDGTLGGGFPDPSDQVGATGLVVSQVSPWLLPVCVLVPLGLVLAAARARAPRWLAVGALAASGLGTLVLLPVPVWSVVAVLTVAGAVLAWAAVRGDQPRPALVAAAAFALAVVPSLSDEVLSLLALGAALAAAAAVHLTTRRPRTAALSGVVLAPLAVGSVWTGRPLGDLSPPWAAVVALAVCGALALAWSEASRSLPGAGPTARARVDATQLGAAVAAAPSVAAGVAEAPAAQQASWAAALLTVSGALVIAASLLWPHRPLSRWVGAGLVALASWIQLADWEVREPEPYTLPSAVLLLVVGLNHLRQQPGSSTATTLAPGLSLALGPSLLWVLEEPVSLRAALLGAACLGLVVAGALLRWASPLVLGSLVGAALVVREAVPFVEAAVPRWVPIAAAGVLLIAMGVTWEQRTRDARRLTAYVRALR